MIRIDVSSRCLDCQVAENASRRNVRFAFTLVELLVALAVITLLAGIALPATKSMLKEQRVSRGASLLQSAIQEARARAVAQGGGGLIIDRRGTASIVDRCESIQIRYLTSPPIYRGEPGANQVIVGTPRLTVADPTTGLISPLGRPLVTLWFPPGASMIERSSTDLANGKFDTLINIGDTIIVGDAGVPMTVYAFNSIVQDSGRVFIASGSPNDDPTVADRNADLLTTFDIPDSDVASWNRVVVEASEANVSLNRFLGEEVSFAVRRTPQPAIAQPILMPKGTSIDLSASGVGSGGNQFSPFAISNDPGTDYDPGNYWDTSVEPFDNSTAPGEALDMGAIHILFDSRGTVSRILGTLNRGLAFGDIPVTGDVYLLVSEAGQIKTDPGEQLEDADSSPLEDAANDGTTPLLNPGSIWVTIRSRTGDVISAPWVNPNGNDNTLVPPKTVADTASLLARNTHQRDRLQATLVLTRSAASQMQEAATR